MTFNNKVKTILTIAFVSCFLFSNAQNQMITRYFDSSWKACSQDTAFFFTQFVKADTLYRSTSYWMGSKKLHCVSGYTDTNFTKAVGLQVAYYENGNKSDSTHFASNGGIQTTYHYRENGTLAYRAFYDKAADELKGENYDSIGKRIPGFFTFQKGAIFADGTEGWVDYLSSHVKSNVPVKKGAPPGNYTVVVSFLVNKEGKVTEVTALNDPGYGTAEEAERVIKNSPSWIPAIQNDKNVVYRQKQSITFQVTKN